MGRIISDIVGRRPTSVTTFYNGRCPVCSRTIARYRERGRARGRELLWRDLNDVPNALLCFDIDREAARRRLHVVDRAGVLRAGIDAFIAIWRELPGYRWLAVIVAVPGVRVLAGLAYDHVLVPTLVSWNHRHDAMPAPRRLGERHG